MRRGFFMQIQIFEIVGRLFYIPGLYSGEHNTYNQINRFFFFFYVVNILNRFFIIKSVS